MACQKMRLACADLVIGFDTEFVRVDISENAENPAEVRDRVSDIKSGNHVLCYSVSFYQPSTGARKSGIIYTEGAGPKHRLAFGTFIAKAIHVAVADGMLDRQRVDAATSNNKLKLVICAHFSRADLPGFRNFDALKKKFDGVRKTYTTIGNPYVLSVKPWRRKDVPVSITLRDTRLIAPAGAGSLKALGNILGFDKLSLPVVTDERGVLVPGITRMDIVQERHPTQFEDYAKRDAEVAVEWLIHVDNLCGEWAIDKLPATIGGIATNKFKTLTTQMDGFLGKVPDPNRPRKRVRHPTIANNLSFMANCFHGGRNECFSHGVFTGDYLDWDVSGAYTSGMAAFREASWDEAKHTKCTEELARLDFISLAHVKFEFPESTRFPSLPIDVGTEGLIYPLRGESYATGPELVVALNQGAKIDVIQGLVIPWADRDGLRPCVEFTSHINRERKKHKKGSPLELLAKEAGNSLFGKFAQGLSKHKTDGSATSKRVFDTRNGEYKALPESSMTQPALAPMITGLLRAVLSEILANLPAHVEVHSVTTDGWLSTASETEARAATHGPVCRYFAQLRALVAPDGSDEILECKKTARKVLVCKTRGTFTIERGGPLNSAILARAGHRLPEPVDCDKCAGECGVVGCPEPDYAEALMWLSLFRARSHDSKILRRQFIDIATQWRGAHDLVTLAVESTMNLEYDMKREPVDLLDEDGLLQFRTRPWSTAEQFLTHRQKFDKWVKSGNTPRTVGDYARFQRWAGRDHRGLQRDQQARTDFEQGVITMCAQGTCGLDVWSRQHRDGLTRQQLAEILTNCRLPVTERSLEARALRNAKPVEGTVTILTGEDRVLWAKLEAVIGEGPLTMLLAI